MRQPTIVAKIFNEFHHYDHVKDDTMTSDLSVPRRKSTGQLSGVRLHHNQHLQNQHHRSQHNSPTPGSDRERRISGDNLLTIHENGNTYNQDMLLKDNTLTSLKNKSKTVKYNEKLEIDESVLDSKTTPMKSLLNADFQHSPKHSYLRNGSRRSLQLPGELSFLSPDSSKTRGRQDELYSLYDGLDRDTCIEEENKRDLTKIEASFTILGGRFERVMKDNKILKQRLVGLQRDQTNTERRYRQRLGDLNRKLMATSTSNANLALENAELITNARLLIQQLQNERALTKLNKKRSRRLSNKRFQAVDESDTEAAISVKHEKDEEEDDEEEGANVVMQRCFDTILHLSLAHQQLMEDELSDSRKHSRKHTRNNHSVKSLQVTSLAGSRIASDVSDVGETNQSTTTSKSAVTCDNEPGEAVSETDSAFTNEDVPLNSEEIADSNSIGSSTPTVTPTSTPTNTPINTPINTPTATPTSPIAHVQIRSPSRGCLRSSVLKDRRNGLDGMLSEDLIANSPTLSAAVASRTASKIAMAFKRLKSKTQASASSTCSSPPETSLFIVQQHHSSKTASLR